MQLSSFIADIVLFETAFAKRGLFARARFGIHSFRKTTLFPREVEGLEEIRGAGRGPRPRGGLTKIGTAGRKVDAAIGGAYRWSSFTIEAFARRLPCSLELCSCPYDTKTRFASWLVSYDGERSSPRNSRNPRATFPDRHRITRFFADNDGTLVIRYHVIRPIQLSLVVLVTGPTGDSLLVSRIVSVSAFLLKEMKGYWFWERTLT